MKNGVRSALLVVVIAAFFSLYFFIDQQQPQFAIEFGDSQETRDAFVSLLTEHDISHHVETDDSGRVWIVPDHEET